MTPFTCVPKGWWPFRKYGFYFRDTLLKEIYIGKWFATGLTESLNEAYRAGYIDGAQTPKSAD